MREFIQKNEMQRYTLGIVYEPDTEDLQGDFADTETIEKACHGFNKTLQAGNEIAKAQGEILKKAFELLNKGASTVEIDVTELLAEVKKGTMALGDMHESWTGEYGDIVESYIMPVDCELDDQPIKKGTWMLGVIWSPDYFEKIQKGDITGYSMGGMAIRKPISAQ